MRTTQVKVTEKKMAKKQIGNSKVRYHKLTETDEGFVDLQFQKPQPRIPYRGIIFAASLFLCGSILVIISCLLFVGHINGNHAEGAWPLLIVGSLMFIPGVYHVRIAYFAYRGYPGYAFDDIPDFDQDGKLYLNKDCKHIQQNHYKNKTSAFHCLLSDQWLVSRVLASSLDVPGSVQAWLFALVQNPLYALGPGLFSPLLHNMTSALQNQ